MTHDARKVAILGATGSIGRSALEVVAASAGRIQVCALSAHRRYDELLALAQKIRPTFVVATDAERADGFHWGDLPSETQLLVGEQGLRRVVQEDEVDIVLAAIVGSAGLTSVWAALEAGKTVALANKEPLVMAGPQIMELARRHGGELLPVDSEHSAVFQMLQAGQRKDVKRIILTASGGPFRGYAPEQLREVTVDDALAHPTWSMGPKISVDSATMMNKTLEMIEARWLFDLAPEQIDVVVHPQSIIHSLVEFVDGSVMAQMSPPDMKLPIQYAFSYPERWPSPAKKLDLTQTCRLDFEPPHEETFPALQLGRDVARKGGSAGCVLNAANEAAVARFLEHDLPFHEIAPVCRAVVESHQHEPHPTMEQLLGLDKWAREEVNK